ncbi:GDSL-type esterase/lipase family protein [uncultured Microbulbifer sp.]|uniref:GDSL-type esterase/lipase family protein n=1 Tax=uncultured Microbulbifer sp. TaxID=348147 RepID=UPI00261343D5|nr:GDSL-type esterase/lipase family protein [uncultured Microbulbifer sp.]
MKQRISMADALKRGGRLLLGTASALILTVLSACTASPALVDTSIDSTTPVTQNRDYATYDWETRHQEILARHEVLNPEVIYLGDSITHFFGGEPKAPLAWGSDAWKTLFEGITVTNMGFGWDRTENVIWRLQNGEIDEISPKVALIMIGTNNLSIDNSPADIFSGVEVIVDEIHARSPLTHIMLLGILPRKDKQSEPRQTNARLRELALREYVEFIDTRPVLLDAEGKLDQAKLRDAVHINESGYSALSKLLRPLLLKKL